MDVLCFADEGAMVEVAVDPLLLDAGSLWPGIGVNEAVKLYPVIGVAAADMTSDRPVRVRAPL